MSVRGIANGSFAPKSVGAISANLANRWAMADAGNRHDQQYTVAQNSGGLSAPRRSPS